MLWMGVLLGAGSGLAQEAVSAHMMKTDGSPRDCTNTHCKKLTMCH